MSAKNGTSNKNKKILDVEFGGFSAGVNTCRIGVSVDRESFNIVDAESLFVNSRLDAILKCDLNDGEDASGQEKLIDTSLKIQSVVDSKSLSVNGDHYSFGLTFNSEETNMAELLKFRKRKGTIAVMRVGDADEGEDD